MLGVESSVEGGYGVLTVLVRKPDTLRIADVLFALGDVLLLLLLILILYDVRGNLYRRKL